MTSEEKQRLEASIKTISEILLKNTPSENLQDFEGIELAVREHFLTQIGPAMGNFFVRASREQEPEEREQ